METVKNQIPRREMIQMSSRIHISLSDEELRKLDDICNKLSLNRSQTIRHLISENRIDKPVYIQDKEVITLLSDIDMCIKVLVLRDVVPLNEALKMLDSLSSIRRMIKEQLED